MWVLHMRPTSTFNFISFKKGKQKNGKTAKQGHFVKMQFASWHKPFKNVKEIWTY